MPQVTYHRGPYESIASSATPGLTWLKSFITTVDSPDSETTGKLAELATSDSVFLFNALPGSPGESVEQTITFLRGRDQAMRSWRHALSTAIDIENDDGSRTIIAEYAAVVEFKDDEPGVKATGPEATIMELVHQGGSWKAKSCRTYMDQSKMGPEHRKKEE